MSSWQAWIWKGASTLWCKALKKIGVDFIIRKLREACAMLRCLFTTEETNSSTPVTEQAQILEEANPAPNQSQLVRSPNDQQRDHQQYSDKAKEPHTNTYIIHGGYFDKPNFGGNSTYNETKKERNSSGTIFDSGIFNQCTIGEKSTYNGTKQEGNPPGTNSARKRNKKKNGRHKKKKNGRR